MEAEDKKFIEELEDSNFSEASDSENAVTFLSVSVALSFAAWFAGGMIVEASGGPASIQLAFAVLAPILYVVWVSATARMKTVSMLYENAVNTSNAANEYKAKSEKVQPLEALTQSLASENQMLSLEVQSLTEKNRLLRSEKQSLERLQGDLSNRINNLERSRESDIATARKDAEDAAFAHASPYIEDGNKAKKALAEANNRLSVLEDAARGEFAIRSATNAGKDASDCIVAQKQLLASNIWLFDLKPNWGVKQSDLNK